MIVFIACGSNNGTNYEPQAEHEHISEIANPANSVADSGEEESISAGYIQDNTDELPPSTGRIFLYGEQHGCGVTMSRQLEIWGYYYTQHGMRHLFIELGYFSAQLLNLWMQTDDDTILYELFEDWRGSAAHNPYKLAFYKTIKKDFPETIFHGTDVGHQSHSSGQRFLRYLRDNGLQDSESYYLAQENIAQFRRFQREGSHAVRAYYKPQNFIREFDRLGNQDVMAIHGMAHVFFGDFQGYSGVPTMATVLYERYGDALQTFDMTHYARMRDPYRVDIITINDIEFEASYFGNDGAIFRNIVGREFWRLENAYDYFQDSPLTGDVLPFDNFPMHVEVGQVFIMDIHFDDGTVHRQFYRASGHYWNNSPATQEFIP